LESGKPAQGRVIFDQISQAVNPGSWVEPSQASRAQAAGGREKLPEDVFGIRDILELLKRRNFQRHTASGIVGCGAQGRLIEEQPGFLHPDRNDTDRSLLGTGFAKMLPNLHHPGLSALAFGVAMDEQQIARIQGESPLDFLG